MSWAVCPDADLITQEYGCTPILSEWIYPACRSGRFHSGMDLGRTDGGANLYRKPVYSTRPGQVVKVGAVTMGGYWVDARVVLYFGDQSVTIRADDGHFLMFGHLDQADCTIGARVKAGDLVGLIGSKGNSTGPHLHFEVRTDGPYQPGPQPTIDPTSYLSVPPGAPAKESEPMNLFRSSEKGADDNPKIYVIEKGRKRHLGGAEFNLWVKAGAKITDVDVSELAPLADDGGTAQGTVTGTLTVT